MDAADACRMNLRPASHRDDLAAVVHILVLVQAAIGVALAIEAAIFLSFTGAAAIPIALGGAVAALAMLVVAGGLGRRARWARRLALIGESAVLLLALADTVLALLTGTILPPPMAVLTRVVLPLAVILLLRRRSVRLAFGVMPRTAALSSGVGL